MHKSDSTRDVRSFDGYLENSNKIERHRTNENRPCVQTQCRSVVECWRFYQCPNRDAHIKRREKGETTHFRYTSLLVTFSVPPLSNISTERRHLGFQNGHQIWIIPIPPKLAKTEVQKTVKHLTATVLNDDDCIWWTILLFIHTFTNIRWSINVLIQVQWSLKRSKIKHIIYRQMKC